MRRTNYVVAVLVCATAAALLWPRTGDAAQEGLKVRFAEGVTHGFLKLSTPEGKRLADGDLLQLPKNGGIEARMVFHFIDGSLFDEVVAFTQHGVFEMQSYRLVQQGPAFEYDLDAKVTRNGDYVVKTKSHKDGKQEIDSGKLEMPPDVFNGMIIIGAKNLAANQGATVHLVAFTPKPRIIRVTYSSMPAQRLEFGKRSESVRHFRLEPKIGGITGVLAKVTGKMPPDSHAWIAVDDVPTFMRFQGPLFLGPVWRIDLTTPEMR